MKIISGAQTGADGAGIDAAIALGMEYGGAIPRGRLTEEGPLDPKYDQITELRSSSYPKCTLKNVLDSDATLLFTVGKISGGTALISKSTWPFSTQRNHRGSWPGILPIAMVTLYQNRASIVSSRLSI